MSNYHSSPSHKCPQCGDSFPTIGACKTHVRAEHQIAIHINGLPPISKLYGFFHCPKCNYRSQNAKNFHCHSHIKEMRRISSGPTGVETLQALTRHSTPAPRSPETGQPLPLIEASTPATPRSPPAGPSPSPIETVEGLDNDPRDKDYEPMDIDEASQPLYASAQELIHPPALQPLQLGIDTEHHCIVCKGCQCAVQRPSLYNHILHIHGHVSRLPSNINAILDEHQVPQHISSPQSKVIPVASIPIISAFISPIPNCGPPGQP